MPRGMVKLSVMGGVVASFCLALSAQAQDVTADLLITGGEIYTPDGWAEAMAVKDGVIIAIGDEADVAGFRAADTEEMDVGGAAIFPGLHDLHVHPMGAGGYRQQCMWPQGSAPEEVLETVAGCVAEKAPGEWIVGSQWDAASFGDTPPHRSMLDDVAPENPVVLTDISGHSVWVNSLALEAAGIDDDTPNPPGGIIERDAEGKATGLLRESGAALVRMQVPPATAEENAEALEWALGEMLSLGITSFTDAFVGPDMMEAYALLADQGLLKHRIRGCVIWRPEIRGSAAAAITDVIASRNLYTNERLALDCVKVVLDGVPTDGHTAAMVEPYADASDPNDARARGISMVPPKILNDAVTAFDAHGITVKFHAAGDAAVRQALDAVEAARKANGFSGIMHDSGHNSFVQMSDIQRARSIGVTFEMSPYIWYPNPIIPDIAKAIGPERMKRWIPVKDALDAGALVVPGSDWPVVPLVNPWIGIETLVTRRALGNQGETLGDPITLEQAFDIFTVNSAVHMGQRDLVGTLEMGMRADMVIVDRNPFDIPVGEIHNTKVLMTLIDGEVVYRNSEQ